MVSVGNVATGISVLGMNPDKCMLAGYEGLAGTSAVDVNWELTTWNAHVGI